MYYSYREIADVTGNNCINTWYKKGKANTDNVSPHIDRIAMNMIEDGRRKFYETEAISVE